MYSNRENPSHKPLDSHIPDESVKTIELSPALKNASIAALVAVLAIIGISSLIVGASNTTASDTEEIEEVASSSATESLTSPPEDTEAALTPEPVEDVAPPVSSPPPAPEVVNTIEAISDPGKLADLNQQLYNTVNNAWQVTPVTADSRYRVRVTENGDIAEYEPTNQAAANNVPNTPLPNLVVANSQAAGESPTVPYAEFEVIFKADNTLQVNSR